MVTIRNIILSLVILSSCAPKDEEKFGITGSWRMVAVECYTVRGQFDSPVETWTPLTPTTFFIEFTAEGRNFTAFNCSTSNSGGGSASYSYQGAYTISSRISSNDGAMDYALSGVTSTNCDIAGTVTNNSTTENVTINFQLDTSKLTNRYFYSDGGTVRLEVPLAYTGGHSAACGAGGASCQSCLVVFN